MKHVRAVGMVVCGVIVASCVPAAHTASPSSSVEGPSASPFAAIDPQMVRDQDDMTWGDYKPIPGDDWANPERRGSVKQVRVAIVTADFPDQPFVLTLPKGSDRFGNPHMDPITRDRVPQFWADFYNKPSSVNHGHTINEYWMEQSHGRVGVSVKAFGPYRMPNRVFQYGLDQADEPGGYSYDRRIQGELDSMWEATSGARIADSFDIVLRLYAGYDETATWQEFGEMKFQTKEDIPADWGSPDSTKPRWVRSRYGAWTPFVAAEWIWSNSAIIQGECINSIRHEIAHAAFKIGDDYNNPFAQPYRRAPAGPWDLMSRGSFNGPGGPHQRWVLPPTEGGSMSAGLMLRQRMLFGFVDSSQVLTLSRDALARSGIAVARVTARGTSPLPGTLAGILVRLDGASPHDRTPVSDPATDPLSPGASTYDTYTLEAVQRFGYDSYEPDNGVLIARNKDRASPVGGPNGFTNFEWVIDAHPEDINKLDFKRPNGEPVMRAISDYRQLNDALFHAGTNSGSKDEWEDAANRLHFYVVDLARDAKGVRSYTLAVRSLDGAGAATRGVEARDPATASVSPRALVYVQVTNPMNTSTQAAPFNQDVYRLHVDSVAGQGWKAQLPSEFAAIVAGETQRVALAVAYEGNAASTATAFVTINSESDPSKRTTVRVQLKKE